MSYFSSDCAAPNEKDPPVEQSIVLDLQLFFPSAPPHESFSLRSFQEMNRHFFVPHRGRGLPLFPVFELGNPDWPAGA